MSKDEILNFFSDINYAYNDSTRLDTLSRMLDELVEQPASPWHRVEEPPDNDRNIFICHGSTNFKAPCIGHYEPGMKLFYEDNNWFASPRL